jgi:hypothetical protein
MTKSNVPPVRTQQWQLYAPCAISKATFRALVERLDKFKPGLATTSRKIKAKAISHAMITDLERADSWKVTDSHFLPELELLQVELLLEANATDSCELHIDFRSERILLSVSDIQTGWLKAVFDEARQLLEDLGVTRRGWKDALGKTYALLQILQILLMAAAVAVFAVWVSRGGDAYLYSSVGFFIAAVIPTLHQVLYFFRPPKKTPIIQEAAPSIRRFPWTEAAAVLGFLAGILGLIKELISLLVAK